MLLVRILILSNLPPLPLLLPLPFSPSPKCQQILKLFSGSGKSHFLDLLASIEHLPLIDSNLSDVDSRISFIDGTSGSKPSPPPSKKAAAPLSKKASQPSKKASPPSKKAPPPSKEAPPPSGEAPPLSEEAHPLHMRLNKEHLMLLSQSHKELRNHLQEALYIRVSFTPLFEGARPLARAILKSYVLYHLPPKSRTKNHASRHVDCRSVLISVTGTSILSVPRVCNGTRSPQP